MKCKGNKFTKKEIIEWTVRKITKQNKKIKGWTGREKMKVRINTKEVRIRTRQEMHKPGALALLLSIGFQCVKANFSMATKGNI